MVGGYDGTRNKHRTRDTGCEGYDAEGPPVIGGIAASAELPDALAILRAPPDRRWRRGLGGAGAPGEPRLSARESHTSKELL